jgi:hypothetical protein
MEKEKKALVCVTLLSARRHLEQPASPGSAQSLSNLLAILPCGAVHAGRRSLTPQ